MFAILQLDICMLLWNSGLDSCFKNHMQRIHVLNGIHWSNALCCWLNSSASRNPFVEHAVQYAVAAAHAKFGKDKTDALQKILLQGNV